MTVLSTVVRENILGDLVNKLISGRSAKPARSHSPNIRKLALIKALNRLVCLFAEITSPMEPVFGPVKIVVSPGG